MKATAKGAAGKRRRPHATKRSPSDKAGRKKVLARRTTTKPAKEQKSGGNSIELRLDLVQQRVLDRFVRSLRRRRGSAPVKLRDHINEKDISLFIGANTEPSGHSLRTSEDVITWLMKAFVRRFSLDDPKTLVDAN